MKLTKGHLFLILLLSLIFCCGLGIFDVVEGMENNDNTTNNAIPTITIPTTDNNKQNTDYSNLNNNYIAASSIHGNGYSQSNFSTIHDTSDISKSVTLDDGRTIYATPENTVNGIIGKNIPPGQEDLYILKSQIVPPVCPACPTVINTGGNNDGNKKCPPCPSCARCPESAFECVKRPTYSADNRYLPVPVLSDFSSFGM